MKPIFVSYYTKGTYEQVIKDYLLPSLKKFRLEYDIEMIEDLGSWNNNTSYKARFILKMLEKYKRDIVILDADATIEKFPILLFEIPTEYDIAVHYLDWYLHWHKQEGRTKRLLLSGTMLFRYNNKIIELVKKYIKISEQNTTRWEQKKLQELGKNNKDIKVYSLPAEYCCVVLKNGNIPEYIKEPVIIHHQASRKYKKRR